MKWFKLKMPFAGKILRPSWTLKPDNFDRGLKIWRLLPANEFLAVELRDTENKTTEFSCISLRTGAILWKGNPFSGKSISSSGEGEAWWITVNKIHRDTLFLQQFARPDMPISGKIFALDLLTGKLLWQNQEISLISLSGDSLFGLQQARDLSHGFLVELNYRTGEEKQKLSTDDPRAADIIDKKGGTSHDAQTDGFIAPEIIEAHEERSLSLRLKLVPSLAINSTVIQLSNKEIIGYYLDAGKDEKGIPVYDAYIMITESGKKIFGDIADRKVYSALQDFFFVVNDRLIYLKNSNEIVAMAI